MNKCPVCNSDYNGICSNCGYDMSCDYEAYPSLMQIDSFASVSKAALKMCLEVPKKKASKRVEYKPTPILYDNQIEGPFVAAYGDYIEAIKKDGSFVFGSAKGDFGSVEISPAGVVAVSDGYRASFVCLLRNGKCWISGIDSIAKTVEKWDNITSIACDRHHIYGLKNTGSVIVAGDVYSPVANRVKKWRDIRFFDAGYDFVVGLKKDGTVVAAGENVFGQCNVQDWYEIGAVSAGDYGVVGLRNDGSVITTDNRWKQEVSKWTSIKAVAAGRHAVVGLKKDGTLLCCTKNKGSFVLTRLWIKVIRILVFQDEHGIEAIGVKRNGTLCYTRDNEARKYRNKAGHNMKMLVSKFQGIRIE